MLDPKRYLQIMSPRHQRVADPVYRREGMDLQRYGDACALRHRKKTTTIFSGLGRTNLDLPITINITFNDLCLATAEGENAIILLG
jgi:hypothetical protein